MDTPSSPQEATATPLPAGFYCYHCAYDLQGLTSDCCPECGKSFDRELLFESQIPWEHRHERGAPRAFWQTAWMATFRSRRLAYEICRPVDYDAARRFRAGVVVLIWIPFAVLSIAPLASGLPALTPLPVEHSGAKVATLVFQNAFFLLAWWIATGFPGYFFHPKYAPLERQNRAVASSYYACAPLAFVPVAAGIGLLIFALGYALNQSGLQFAGALFAGILDALLGLLYCVVVLVLQGRLFGMQRGLRMLVLWPICWIPVVLALGLVGFGFHYMLIMFLTLMDKF